MLATSRPTPPSGEEGIVGYSCPSFHRYPRTCCSKFPYSTAQADPIADTTHFVYNLTMELSEQGIELIKGRESCRLTPYLDSVGVWTDGWGNTTGVVPHGPPITQEKADADLAHNLAVFQAAVNHAVKVPIEQYSFDALTSFSFNVGVGAFSSSTLVRKINEGAFAEAASQFDRWHIPPEVTSRRTGEREQFKGTAFQPRIPA